MPSFRKSASVQHSFQGRHRFEHWYRDNTVYFITTSTRDHFCAFASAAAKAIFWDRFDYYCALHGFAPWVTTLLTTHYHTIGYLKSATELPQLMRKLHGSIAKLTNDVLEVRRVPFWRDRGARD